MIFKYPHTDFYKGDGNDNWILAKLKELEDAIKKLFKASGSDLVNVSDQEAFAHIKATATPQGFCLFNYNNIDYAAYCFEGSVMVDTFPEPTSAKVYTSAMLTHCNDVTYRKGHLYIANGESKKVTIIDLSDDGIKEQTLTFTTNVHGIAYDEIHDVFKILDRDSEGAFILTCVPWLTSYLTKVKVDYGENATDKQGISCDAKYLYLIAGNHQRSNFGVLNWVNVYDLETVNFVKKIDIPLGMELEGLDQINGSAYFWYNCYSVSGVLTKGSLYNTEQAYGLYPDQNWGFGRFNTSEEVYIAEDSTDFLMDGTVNHPFLSWFEANAFMNNGNRPYYHVMLLTDLTGDFVINSNKFKSLGIYAAGSGSKEIKGLIDIRSMTYIHIVDVNLNSDNATIQKVSNVRFDNVSLLKAISLNEVQSLRITGVYTADDDVINSDRLLGQIRIDALPSNKTKWHPVATSCSEMIGTDLNVCKGIVTTLPTQNGAYVSLESGNTIADLNLSGMYYLATDVAVTDRPDMRGSDLKLDTFRNVRRFEYMNRDNVDRYIRTIDDGTGYDTGWMRYTKNSFDNVILYIDPINGDDGNDGTSQQKAMKTFKNAFQKYPYSYITFNVLPGVTYTENIGTIRGRLFSISSASENNHAIFTKQISLVACSCIIRYCDIITTDDNSVRATYTSTVLLQSCTLSANATDLYLAGNSKAYAYGNMILDGGSYGLYCIQGCDVRLTDTQIINTTTAPIRSRSICDVTIYNCTYTGNIVEDTGGIVTIRQ
ncbi:MAG: right-handed parallel beta-helix repeat-containing protein [Paludibacteraceae bacterium]|nr:right-handed parallel beta-helix repeat-containing protein [Paludibacteraceae bacterium]